MHKTLILCKMNLKLIFHNKVHIINIILFSLIPFIVNIVFINVIKSKFFNPLHQDAFAQLFFDPSNMNIPIVVLSLFMVIVCSFVIASMFNFNYHENGIDIIVISKPYSRTKIILAKMISVLIVILLLAFIALTSLLILNFFNNGDYSANVNLIFSIFLGIIIFGILSSIISLLFVLFLNKTWSTVLPIIIFMALFFSSLLIRSEAFSRIDKYNFSYYMYKKDKDDSDFIIKEEQIKNNKLIKLDKQKTIKKDTHKGSFPSGIEENKYQKYQNADFWHQISSIFFIMKSRPKDYIFKIKKATISICNNFLIKNIKQNEPITKKNIIGLVLEHDEVEIYNKYIKSKEVEINDIVNKINTNINKKSKRIIHLENNKEIKKVYDPSKEIKDLFGESVGKLVLKDKEALPIISFSELETIKKIVLFKYIKKYSLKEYSFSPTKYDGSISTKIFILKGKPYSKNYLILLIWTLILSSFFISSLVLVFKKSFK